MKSTRSLALISWLLGFFIMANVYLIPGNNSSPRALDGLSLILWFWLVWRFLAGGIRSTPLVALAAMNLIPLMWGIYAYNQGLRPTMLLSLRWLLAMPWGYVLYLLAENRLARTNLIWGLWWGLVVNVAVLIMQYSGHEALAIRLGLAAQDSDIISIERFLFRSSGMHGHANASGAVASLIVPIGLYLYYRCGYGVWVPLASLGLLLVAGHVTSSRSPLLVSALGFGLVALTSRRFMRSITLLFLVCLLAWPFWMLYGPPGGKIRWADTVHMAANTNERLASNVTAAQIASENVLGLGIEAGRAAMTEKLHNPATHNAFLHIGIVYGPVQAILLLIMLSMLAWNAIKGIQRPWGLEAILAFHTVGLFMFEEHLNNPTFIVLIAWLVCAGAGRLTSPSPGLVQQSPANVS